MDTPKGMLTVAGLGIQIGADITRATEGYIRNADRVFFIVNQEIAATWVKELNPKAESLQHLYFVHKERIKNYEAIAQHVANSLKADEYTVFVLYGHPGVFAYFGHRAIKLAREKGFRAKMLPGISAEDWLYADREIDPGLSGCISYEVNDFIKNNRVFSSQSHLIIWQIGSFNVSTVVTKEVTTTIDLQPLTERLLEQYPNDHEIIIYEAALYPTDKPVINRFQLKDLTKQKPTIISTLYIPPIPND